MAARVDTSRRSTSRGRSTLWPSQRVCRDSPNSVCCRPSPSPSSSSLPSTTVPGVLGNVYLKTHPCGGLGSRCSLDRSSPPPPLCFVHFPGNLVLLTGRGRRSASDTFVLVSFGETFLLIIRLPNGQSAITYRQRSTAPDKRISSPAHQRTTKSV